MKKFLILLSLMFCNTVCADTINLHWLNYDGTSYQDSTCVIDSDLILPSAPPTRYGYTFTGWKISGYTPIEYLESTGTQYIDTGIAFNDTLLQYPFALDFTVAITQNLKTTSTGYYFSGATGHVMSTSHYTWSSNINSIGIYVTSGNSMCTAFHDNQLHIPVNIRFEFNQNNCTFFSTNGTDTQSGNFSNNCSLATSNLNLYLFKSNGSSYVRPIRIYRWAYESNGVKIRDFIPILDENGTPCMFDKVTGMLFYNQGTGNFIAGPVLQ